VAAQYFMVGMYDGGDLFTSWYLANKENKRKIQGTNIPF
jgi:hypothetical protein